MPKTDLTFNPSDYALVAERIALFYERYPTGRIVPRLHSVTKDAVIFEALVYRDKADTEPAAIGWAREFEGDGDINEVACLENTETSAIGRALANLGFAASKKRPSYEEMMKADRARRRLATQTLATASMSAIPSPKPRECAASGPLQERANAAMDLVRLIRTAERLGLPPKRADIEYDRHGNVTKHTSRRGANVRFTYDELDRVKTRVGDAIGAAAKDSAAFSYDPQNRWVAVSNAESVDTLRLFSNGQPNEAVSRRGTERWYTVQSAYDDEGLLNLKRLTVAWVSGYQSGQPIWVETKDSVMLGYDAALRQSLLARFPSGAYKGTDITYNRDGLLKRVWVPTGTSSSDRLRLTYTYTPAHGVDTLVLNRTDLHAALGRSYTHDSLDRISSIAWGPSSSRKVRQVEYTALGRLKSATDENHWQEFEVVCSDPFDPTSCYPEMIFHVDTLRREEFTYDRAGNRTDRSAVVQTGNRVTSVDGYTLTYDDDGNVTSKSKAGVWSQSFTWNALGQLVQVVTNGVTTTFGYDGWGRRARKTVGTTRTDYVLDGDQVIADVDGAGSLLRSYAYYPGMDKPHSVKVAAAMYYYVTEAPGQVSGLVNASNQLVNSYQYTSFGEAITATEQVAQPLRFGAREFDADTKLYFNRARYYDPHVGRFISEDPIRLKGGINLFAYAGNDPVNATDPLGLRTCTAVAVTVYDLVDGELTTKRWWIWLCTESGSVIDQIADWLNTQLGMGSGASGWWGMGPCPGSERCGEILSAAQRLAGSAGFCGLLGSNGVARYRAGNYAYNFEGFPPEGSIYAHSWGPGHLLAGRTTFGGPAFAPSWDMAITIAEEEFHHFLWGSPNGPSRDPAGMFDHDTVRAWAYRCAASGSPLPSGI